MNEHRSLLIHVCCAPCLSGIADYLKSLDFERIYGYFYNPNIHPYKEFKKRRHHVRLNEKTFGLDGFIYSDDYSLIEILTGMTNANDRCEFCFRNRMESAARTACENDFTHYTTTLLISPYQKQQLLVGIGNEMGEKYGVEFIDEDMRRFYDLSREISKKLDMYRQGYCGCIFSEYERYGPHKSGDSV